MYIQFDTPPVVDPRDKGYICKCCGLFVKRYCRPLNSNMALALIVLYKSGLKDYVHLENLMAEKGYKRCGDASYLIYWRFLERLRERRPDNSTRNGMYRITPMGIMFVEGKIKAKARCYVFNNSWEGFTGEEINILDALGTKFSYADLMQE